MPAYRELSDSELAQRIAREFGNAVAYDDWNFQRCKENWRFYWGIDAERGMGQWPADAVNEMVREGRHIATYNLCRPTVDNLAGAIAKTPFSVDFSPVSDDLSSLTYSIKDLFTIDKELCDWDQAMASLVMAGLIYRGDVELFRNREYDKRFGNIGLRYRLPGSVTYDPYWKTPRQKDCRKCWVTSWMTPMELIDLFVDKRDDIKLAVLAKRAKDTGQDIKQVILAQAELQARMGDEYGDPYGIVPYPNDADMWGKQYRVIQHYHMEKMRIKSEFVMLSSGGRRRIPDTLADVQEKAEWLNQNVPDWIPDAVIEDEEEEDVQIVTTVCPVLSPVMILENRPTEVQCGRLQFFPWSANKLNGQWSGVVDAVKDLQLQVNYWESLLTNKIQTEGGGGSQFLDPEGFDSEVERERYVADRNNPRNVFKLKPGYLRQNANGPAIPTAKSSFPSEVTNHLQHLIDVVLPRLTPVTPAAQGRSESSTESGYLYRLKKMQSDIQSYTIFQGLKYLWNDIGEAYLMEASRTYGNGVERSLYNPSTKSAVVINERRVDNGFEVIVNDMAMLREMRHRVIVTESEDAPTRKVEAMTVAAEAMRAMPPTKILTIGELATTLALSLDNFDEEKKERLKRYCGLETELAEQQIKTQIVTLKAQELQASGMIQAAMNPPAMQPGGGQMGQMPVTAQPAGQPPVQIPGVPKQEEVPVRTPAMATSQA